MPLILINHLLKYWCPGWRDYETNVKLTRLRNFYGPMELSQDSYSLCGSAVSCAIYLTMRHAHGLASWYQLLHHIGYDSGYDSDLSTLQMTHSWSQLPCSRYDHIFYFLRKEGKQLLWSCCNQILKPTQFDGILVERVTFSQSPVYRLCHMSCSGEFSR